MERPALGACRRHLLQTTAPAWSSAVLVSCSQCHGRAGALPSQGQRSQGSMQSGQRVLLACGWLPVGFQPVATRAPLRQLPTSSFQPRSPGVGGRRLATSAACSISPAPLGAAPACARYWNSRTAWSSHPPPCKLQRGPPSGPASRGPGRRAPAPRVSHQLINQSKKSCWRCHHTCSTELRTPGRSLLLRAHRPKTPHTLRVGCLVAVHTWLAHHLTKAVTRASPWRSTLAGSGLVLRTASGHRTQRRVGAWGGAGFTRLWGAGSTGSRPLRSLCPVAASRSHPARPTRKSAIWSSSARVVRRVAAS